jgi:hypothetical protein
MTDFIAPSGNIKSVIPCRAAAIPTPPIVDDRLSPEALGVYVWLCASTPDELDGPSALTERFAIGRDKLGRILRELESLGYLDRANIRDRGRFIGSRYTINGTPSL